jgi:peroxiredoxin
MNRLLSSLLVASVVTLLSNSVFVGCNHKSLEAMPRWELLDMDGSKISSREFEGKVVVVDFWATWCQTCVQELPAFTALQEKYGKDGLVVIGIALDELGAQSVKPFIRQHAINFTVLAGDTSVQLAFGGLDGLPTTFIFDRDGKLVSKHSSYQEPGVFEKEVAPLLARKAVKQERPPAR